MQLARSVRNRTTGVLYVLDEPSIGLHPSNLEGLTGVMQDLVADGNSVLLVDHDTQVLSKADWLIEMGPQAGAGGGRVVAQGTPEALARMPASLIGPFLSGRRRGGAAARQSGGIVPCRAAAAFHLGHPYGKAAFRRHSKGQAHCGDRVFPAAERRRSCWRALCPPWRRQQPAQSPRHMCCPSKRPVLRGPS